MQKLHKIKAPVQNIFSIFLALFCLRIQWNFQTNGLVLPNKLNRFLYETFVFISAAGCGHIEMVKWLIEKGADGK